MPFDESMARYGNDKPDLRWGLEHVVLTDVVTAHGGEGGVPMLLEAVQQGGIVKAMVIPAAHPLSRAEADKLEEFAMGSGARGLARAKVGEGGEWTQSPRPSPPRPPPSTRPARRLKELILFQFGKPSVVHTGYGQPRSRRRLGLIPRSGGVAHGSSQVVDTRCSSRRGRRGWVWHTTPSPAHDGDVGTPHRRAG
jgi:aspartyl-tRNA synthetase